MKIIISPAKKMNIDTNSLDYNSLPCFLRETKEIHEVLKGMSLLDLRKMWNCNENIASENYDRIHNFDIEKNLTPAILSYEGIQYKYMAPAVFEKDMFEYISENLRILSGFYGVLKPMDGVIPYRLEMQAKISICDKENLYSFWADKLYHELDDDIILNLASKEYSKCIEKYLKPSDKYITCVFGELKDDKIIQKATFAKMARGEMVRFMAQNNIQDLENIKKFNLLGFKYSEKYSNETEYVFLLDKDKKEDNYEE